MKSAATYMDLPYTIVLRPDEEGDIVAKIEELPGCSSHGRNHAEAMEHLREAQRLWIEDCLEAGQLVPEPVIQDLLPSGKWVQRVPRSLHQKLVRLARQEGVSLNQLVTACLAEVTGQRELTQATFTVTRAPAPDSATWTVPGQLMRWHGRHGARGGGKWGFAWASCRRGSRSEVNAQHDC